MTIRVHHVHPCPPVLGHVRPLSPPLGGTSGQTVDKRNRTMNVWRVRAADPRTGIVRKSQLFHQLHAAKRRGIRWRDHGYVVTLELAEAVTFRPMWPHATERSNP